MKVINETRYETTSLRALALRVAREELDAAKAKLVTVTYRETVRGISTDDAMGRCFIGGNRITVFLPANPAKVDIEVTAHVLAHEYGHARGLDHAAMRNNPRYSWGCDYNSEVRAWRQVVRDRGCCEGLEIVPRPRKLKARPTDEAKMAHALELVAAWDRKRRRAETAIRKWKTKARYYERKIAAKGVP